MVPADPNMVSEPGLVVHEDDVPEEGEAIIADDAVALPGVPEVDESEEEDVPDEDEYDETRSRTPRTPLGK